MNHIGPDVASGPRRVAARRGLPPLNGRATGWLRLRRGPVNLVLFARLAAHVVRGRETHPARDCTGHSDGTFCLGSLSMLIVDVSQPEEAT
jgi:hypothetical protein